LTHRGTLATLTVLPPSAKERLFGCSSDLEYRDPMATSEIEKLERRYAENPQGLTFAPLAEVHRKNGDVARALELLLAGLELHPNYIPASIVLGRCHWDLGDLPAAEAAFAHVLRLDDENVIALKSLADINERLERFGEAQRWLNRLIAVDRSNDEARQQLSRLQAAKGPAPRETDLPHEIAALDAKPAAAAAKPPSPTPTIAPPERTPAESTPVDLTAAIAEAGPSAEAKQPRLETDTKSTKLEFLDTSEQEPPGEPAPLPGLISQEFEPPKEATYRLHPELTREFESDRESLPDLHVEINEEVELRSSGASEFRVPNAAEEFMDLAAGVLGEREPTPVSRSAEREPPPATLVPAPTELPQEPAEFTPKVVPAAAIPTGREPVASEKVAEEKRRGEEKRQAEDKKPAYSANETKGQSVASFFQALLAARPTGNSNSPVSQDSASPDGVAPTRHTQDAGSLSSVFGQDRLQSPPTVPAAGQTKDAAVSFDDFFGAAGGSNPRPAGSADPRNDDLDQFQSWLQNLKR
jgi:hypothetical protein